jgi:integrase
MRASYFLELDEVLRVLRDMHRRTRPRTRISISKRLDLTIFRLSCCCGLRRIEIVKLQMRDFNFSGPRPCITIRREATKGQQHLRQGREVPLWWDSGTRKDLQAWYDWRLQNGATDTEPFVCQVQKPTMGKILEESLVSKRWRTAIRGCLGKQRAKQVPIHAGRHTFASLSLQGGRSLVAVRDALGHKSVSTTSIYLHCIQESVPDVFKT